MNETIILIDGSELQCYPVAIQPEEKVDGDLALDTTGRYLLVGNQRRPTEEPKDLKDERDKAEKLFYEHAYLFLANADRILSDSRLFLAPVGVVSGLAYTGTSGFRHPTLGIYIEWWLYYKEASIDANGFPIWLISGSPMSGRNACQSVNRKGKPVRARLNDRFLPVWTTFQTVNNLYNDAKLRYMAYSLQEVIDILEGTTSSDRLFRLHLRLEKARYDNYISCLKTELKKARKVSDGYLDKIQHLLVKQNKEAALSYYGKCVNLETTARLARDYFLEQRIINHRKLRAGEITNRTYQEITVPLRKKADEAKSEANYYLGNGLSEAFGDEAAYLSYTAIESILKELNEIPNDTTDLPQSSRLL